MARAKNIRSLNQRPGQQIKEQYRGCNRVGWPSHWDVGQPLNHQHEMSNMPAVKPGGSGDLLPPSLPA